MEKPKDCRNCKEKKAMQFVKIGKNEEGEDVKIYHCLKCNFREGLPIQHDKKSRADRL